MGIADVAVDFRLGHEGGDRVDDDDVDAVRADENLGDLQGLLAEVRLGDEQVVDIDAQPCGIAGVKGVFRVDKGGGAADFLGLGDDLQGQGGFAGRFRTIDLGDPALGQTADTEGDIEAQGPGGNDRHVLGLLRAETHDRALAELSLDLADCVVDTADSFLAWAYGHMASPI